MGRALAAVILLVGFHLFVAASDSALTAFHDLGKQGDVIYPEGAHVYLAQRAQRQEAVYRDFGTPPHVPALYGPLPYYTVGWIGRLLNAETPKLYVVGRCSCLFATVATLMMLCYGSRNPRGVAGGLVAVGVCLVGIDAMKISVAYRPDVPAAALALTGLLLAERRFVRSAALLFVLASLFKQNYVTAPLVAGGWLLLNQSRSQAVRFGSTYLVTMVVAWGTCYVVFGPPLVQNMVTANLLPFDWSIGVQALGDHWLKFLLPAVGVVLYLFDSRAVRKWDLACLYAVCSLAVGILTISKVGSAVNHMLEFLVGACWCTGRWLNGKWAKAPIGPVQHGEQARPDLRWALVPLGPSLVFLVAALVTVALQWREDGGLMHRIVARCSIWFQPSASGQADSSAVSDQAITHGMIKLTRQYPGPLLCSDPYLSVSSGKDPVAIDWVLWSMLAQNGQLSLRPVLDRLQQGEYEIVVLDFDPEGPMPTLSGVPIWPSAVVRAVLENYVPRLAMGRFRAYVPRKH